MKKTLLAVILVAVVVGGGAFYGGMKYEQGKSSRGFGQFSMANIGGARGGRMGANGGFTAGDIISKDASSITIKLRNGGSEIVFFGDTTEVGKFVSGTPTDLAVGQSVSISGKANPDGSITAQSIQIRPNLPTPTSAQ